MGSSRKEKTAGEKNMIDDRNELERKADRERDSEINQFSLACMLGMVAFGTLIAMCNSEPRPRFQESKETYSYDIGGGMASTYLVDTNKDGKADIHIHDGAAPRGRFHTERTPTLEEQRQFSSEYHKYISSKTTPTLPEHK